jgi:hypothetical protein
MIGYLYVGEFTSWLSAYESKLKDYPNYKAFYKKYRNRCELYIKSI